MPRNPESLFWDSVRPLLQGLHPVRIENGVGQGTPDVNCTLGWIELKQVREIPKRASTVVRLDHFTDKQKVWLTRRWEAGGACGLLLKMAGEWMLFLAPTAVKYVGQSTADDLRYHACNHWKRKPSKDEFQAALRRLTP